MPRSLSWIEPGALAAALARAGVGPTASARMASPRPRPVTAPPPAPPPPPAVAPLPPAPEVAAVSPFAPPEGNLAQRLEAFCEWLSRSLACRGIFVADQDGLPIVEKNTGDELAAAAPLITRFLDLVHSRHPFVDDSGLALALRTGERIHVLQERSDAGRICLGLVVAGPVPTPLLELAQQGFGRALAAPAAAASATRNRPVEDR